MIPPFDERGSLLAGIHKATWNEVEIRFGQSPKRKFLGVDLEVLDPLFLDFSNGRQAQKQRFGGELFPADMVVEPERIRILDFFQRERVSGRAKGIVEVDLEAGL